MLCEYESSQINDIFNAHQVKTRISVDQKLIEKEALGKEALGKEPLNILFMN